MTKEEALAAMKALSEVRDSEGRHGDADEILCERLRALGETELVELFESFEKWYA